MIVSSFFLLFFLGIILRLFYWQVVQADKLEGLAEKQRMTTLPITAQRGQIFSSDGSPLVLNQRSFGVYLEPKNITDLPKVMDILSKDLSIPVSTISARLDGSTALWLPLAHRVDENAVNAVKNENLKGIEFLDEPKRYYPESSMAAHLLGFVGKNSAGGDQGYFGLEGYYDQQLKGRDGSLSQETDALGNPILSGNIEKIPAENGRDLILYLDKTIQYIVEKELLSGIQQFGAKGGSVIVMDPQSGGILAMASYPSYDPGNYLNFPAEYYKNPAVASSYEPGSTFKTLVMSSAINDGVITPETKYHEDGPVGIGGYTINTWNQKYHGEISMAQILEYSSNVGMVFIGGKMNKNSFQNYIKNLGFGALTGVDLQEEASPELRPENKWYDIDYATASFGQGIAVTPLQMVRAVSAIANGGRLMEPHVVKSIHLPDGETININPNVEKVVFNRKTTDYVTEMMVEAVDNGETKMIKPAGFRIAGKTGTAQIPISGHYDTSKTIASFVGFAPVDDPRFVMLVTLTEPTTSPWGSETAAPIFFNISKEIFPYLKISPSD